MKLHLPKLLLSAVLALMVSGQATALTRTEQYGAVTFDTNKTYTGVDYSYDKDTGTLTINKSDLSILNLTFTLNYDAFDALTATQELLYVNWRRETDSGTCGLRATADATVTGNANGSDHAASDGMTATTLAGYITTETTGNSTTRYISGLKASIDGTTANTGTTLQTSDNQYVYKNAGLRYTTSTFSSAYINNSLISSVTLQDKTYTYSNGKGWTKTFAVGQVTDATTSTKLLLTGGDNGSVATNTKPIVVGGSGALHLEAWKQGIVNLDDDLYLSSSTYNDGAYNNVNDYGVVRISNDGDYTANLSGNIYLVEDSSIKVTGTKLVNISGLITDKGVPSDSGTMDGDYTLTLGGSGINVSGKVDVGGLNIVQRFDSNLQYKPGTTTLSSSDAKVDKLTVGTNATLTVTGALTVGSTVSNQGTIDLSSGSLTFENLDAEHYDREAYYNGTGDSKTVSANGYTDTSKLLLAGGNVTVTDSTQIIGTGLASWENVTGTGLVGTLANGGFDDKTFYVNSGTVRLSTTTASSDGVTYSDNSATTYVVKSGATLDVYFKKSEFNGDYALVDRKILLENGATLTNTGDNGSSNLKQLHKIELTGDATVNATSNNTYGFLAANYGESTLTLNGHTLEKTGDGEFRLLNTTVTAGTIKITEGTINVVRDQKTTNTTAAGIVLNGANATLKVSEGATLKAGTISGTGKIEVEKGKLTTTGINTTGNINIKDGSVALSGGGSISNIGLNADGAKIDFLAAEGQTESTYTVGKIATNLNEEIGDRYNSSIHVGENVVVNATGLTNNWGLKALTVNGKLNISGTLLFSTGTNTGGTTNLINGTGTIVTENFTAQNVGTLYTLNVANLTVKNNTQIKIATEIAGGNVDLGNITVISTNLTNSGGDVTIASISGSNDNGQIIAKGGTVTLETGEHSIAKIDASTILAGQTAEITLEEKAKLAVTGDLKLAIGTASINLEEGATLTRGSVTVTGIDHADGTSISRVANELNTASYSIDNTSYVINNADVEVISDSAQTISNRLQGVGLTNAGTGKLTAGNGYNYFTGIEAQKGSIEINGFANSDLQGELSLLAIEKELTVTINNLWNDKAKKADVSVQGTATFGIGATLQANLELKSGTNLTLDGALNMSHSTLTLGESLVLDSATLQKIQEKTGERVELFNNVSKLILGDKQYIMGKDILDETFGIALSDWFVLTTPDLSTQLSSDILPSLGDFYLGYDANGSVYAGWTVPEPATATLSLLALAGLVARRRRK